ncbi:MAG: hypothetical protein KA369_21960 [Spirochaetes bacterium]|nr:hypothetical protein [Spirochaetota bacterium]
MTPVRIITREQAMTAIECGDFGSDVTASSRKVAVLMTQDWCPQWADMKKWFYSLEADCDLYELIYNKVDFFNEFRNFKERTWKNGLIPYIRYYNGGKLVAESNHVSKEEFMRNLGV